MHQSWVLAFYTELPPCHLYIWTALDPYKEINRSGDALPQVCQPPRNLSKSPVEPECRGISDASESYAYPLKADGDARAMAHRARVCEGPRGRERGAIVWGTERCLSAM